MKYTTDIRKARRFKDQDDALEYALKHVNRRFSLETTGDPGSRKKYFVIEVQTNCLYVR